MGRDRSGVSKSVKWRLVFYGGLLLALLLCIAYVTVMPGASYAGAAPPASPDERALALALKTHVTALAEGIGERHTGRPASLEQSRDHLISVVRGFPGIRPEQVRTETLGPAGKEAENIIVELAGLTPELVVVGAHYDSAEGAPGADDNASGVAATLELTRLLARERFHRTLRFVLFANEEAPYFHTAGMGALVHARGCRQRGETIEAMLSLESLGYYSDAPGSQKYPAPLSLLYPSHGNFVAFVGNLASRSLVREAIGTFRATAQFPSEGAALPAGIPGVGWSDHWAFWQAGYPAIMVTDTAPYRNPHYHRSTDAPATLDYPRLARVTYALAHVVRHLAQPQ